MILEWVKTLGPILISWPVVGLIAILVFRKPLLALADRLTGEDVQRIKFGSVELEMVKVAVDQAESEIDRLYALSMSEDQFDQLKRLSLASYGSFWLDPELKVGLAPELNYLKMIGYIKFDRDPNVVDVRDLPKGGHPDDNLSNYISVTPLGHEFIAFREKAQERLTKRSSGRPATPPA
jgi:hypothetical protein